MSEEKPKEIKRPRPGGITALSVNRVIDWAIKGASIVITANATDDGVMEFIIDCDGTAGNLFVDSFTCS